MAEGIEAAAERWRRFFHGEMGTLERDEYYHDALSVEDRDALCQWASDRLAADRAEPEERARHVLEVRCDGNGYDWLRDGEMVQARIGFNDPAVPALMLLGVKLKGRCGVSDEKQTAVLGDGCKITPLGFTDEFLESRGFSWCEPAEAWVKTCSDGRTIHVKERWQVIADGPGGCVEIFARTCDDLDALIRLLTPGD